MYLLFHPLEGTVVGFQETKYVFEDVDGGTYEETVLCQCPRIRLVWVKVQDKKKD